jgi:hypothetical protein
MRGYQRPNYRQSRLIRMAMNHSQLPSWSAAPLLPWSTVTILGLDKQFWSILSKSMLSKTSRAPMKHIKHTYCHGMRESWKVLASLTATQYLERTKRLDELLMSLSQKEQMSGRQYE